MISKILIGCTVLICIHNCTILGSTIKSKRSFSENIQSGIKLAQKIFGGFDVDTSNNVANLVAKAFSTPNKSDLYKNDSLPSGSAMLSNLLQIIGLDSGKVGALAVNAIIFIAQMINKALTINSTQQSSMSPSARSLEAVTSNKDEKSIKQNTVTNEFNKKEQKRSEYLIDSPLSWIFQRNTTEFSKQMINVRDKFLPQYLAELITTYEHKPGEADCMKILICKGAPIIWGMQNAINDHLNGTDDIENESSDVNYAKTKKLSSNKEFLNSFYKYLPEIEHFQYHGDGCEERYHHCKLFDK